MTRQERRKRRRQRRRRMQAGILLSLVLVLGLVIALRAGKERETLEQEIPLAAERQTLAYIAPAPALPDTAAEETRNSISATRTFISLLASFTTRRAARASRDKSPSSRSF